MSTHRLLLALLVWVLGWVAIVPSAVAGPPTAPDSSEDAVARTTADPDIKPADLKILLAPLPRAQLEIELDAWFVLVQRAAQAVSDLELELKRKERAKKANPDAPAADDTNNVDDLSAVIAKRTEAVDRFRQVMASFEKKGGDIDEYKQYLGAVTGVNVDTKDAGSTYKALQAWVKSDEGGRRWLGNLAKFALVLVAFVVLALLAGLVVRVAASRAIAKRSKLLASFLVSTTRRVILLGGLLVAISTLEVDMTPILAMLGAAGFVVGFALQGTLGNLASGLMILAYRPFDVDDAVIVASVTGKVS